MIDNAGRNRGWSVGIIIVLLVILAWLFFAWTDGDRRRPAQNVTNQVEVGNQVSSRDFVVASVNAEDPGYIVIYNSTNLSSVNIVGRSNLLDEGINPNVTVSLNGSVEMGEVLYAVYQRDNGDGVYNSSQDMPATSNTGSVLASAFIVTNNSSGNTTTNQTNSTTNGSITTDSRVRVIDNASAGSNFTVEMTNSGFIPSRLNISVGEVVAFDNQLANSTITLDESEIDQILNENDQINLQFNEEGNYTIYNRFMGQPGEGMYMTIIVSRSSVNSTDPSEVGNTSSNNTANASFENSTSNNGSLEDSDNNSGL